MRKVRVHLYLDVAENISEDQIEEYFEEMEDDMQEHFMEMQFAENDGIYINDVKVYSKD